MLGSFCSARRQLETRDPDVVPADAAEPARGFEDRVILCCLGHGCPLKPQTADLPPVSGLMWFSERRKITRHMTLKNPFLALEFPDGLSRSAASAPDAGAGPHRTSYRPARIRARSSRSARPE